MKQSQRVALLTLLNREMLTRNSWCGETHIQKAAFLLQEMAGVDMGYEFILYRHGPFSFDLRDELMSMQADQLLELVIRQEGYGPSFFPTEFSESFLERFPSTTARYGQQVRFIADELGDKGVVELERLATAFFITDHERVTDVETRACRLVEIKPHIPLAEARRAIEQIDRLIHRARAFLVEESESV